MKGLKMKRRGNLHSSATAGLVVKNRWLVVCIAEVRAHVVCSKYSENDDLPAPYACHLTSVSYSVELKEPLSTFTF